MPSCKVSFVLQHSQDVLTTTTLLLHAKCEKKKKVLILYSNKKYIFKPPVEVICSLSRISPMNSTLTLSGSKIQGVRVELAGNKVIEYCTREL